MQLANRISTDAHAPAGPGRFVLGLGGTIDYEIAWSGRVLEKLAMEWGIRLDECDPLVPITDERQLVRAILGFVAADQGGERFVEAIDTIRRFAARFEAEVTLGGTCVRAGLIMRTLGVRSTVHLVSIDDDFRRLFPADCDYLSSASAEGMYPHLIIQLPSHDTISVADGEIEVAHANRIIFANDPPHREMALSSSLAEALGTAEVFLVSGFNVMTDAILLENRLVELRSAMANLATDSIVMYEDAAYHTVGMSDIVDKTLSPIVDVFSMNEDELQSRLRRSVDFMEPEDVARALSQVREVVSSAVIVVHTRHWAIAFGAGSTSFEKSLDFGVAAATARYAHGDAVSAPQVDEIARREPAEAGRRFAVAIAALAAEPTVCVPVATVHVDRPTTIGLGDCFVGGFLTGIDRVAARSKDRREPA